jgi:hypothetical protein
MPDRVDIMVEEMALPTLVSHVAERAFLADLDRESDFEPVALYSDLALVRKAGNTLRDEGAFNFGPDLKEIISLEGGTMQVINLTEGWSVTLVPMMGRVDGHEWVFHHKCEEGSSIVGRLQKNTHKRHGVRYRCTLCKAIAPKSVLVQMKLKNLGEAK